ncbi:hypothetical protein GH714_037611 [Hevea brasiliensis]|uniref:PORR domain-containing protein n=1 Tax=Hevea brasiliensis TaxID=3981 RepID=A0A6A6K9I3_HEVBR|nr:hypothetical protein GH714_037611 [Hevea brasiliensis]
MTTSKRVQDRSSKKRVHDLEIVTEKWKIVSKVMAVMEVLKWEVDMVITLRNLEQYRNRINLPKPHKISVFLSKSPKLFELYKDQRGVLWCGMTKEAEDLLEEQERLIEEHSDKAVEYVNRCLMMSVDKQLRVDEIAHFRRDFGLPMGFRTKWVHKYPKLFRVVKSGDGEEYLKLVSWKPAWAIIEMATQIVKAEALMNKFNEANVFLFLPMRTKWSAGPLLSSPFISVEECAIEEAGQAMNKDGVLGDHSA